MKIKVVFLQDSKYGKRWQIKDVSIPFFKNVLYPNKFAVKVDSAEWKRFLKKLEEKSIEHQKEVKKIKEILNDLKNNWLTLIRKQTPKWHFYNKIFPQDISEEILKKYWLKIPKEKIILDDKIEEPGEYKVKIDFHWVKWEFRLIAKWE